MRTILLLVVLTFTLVAPAQRLLTKDELITLWSSYESTKLQASGLPNMDSISHSFLQNLTDSLLDAHVDSFLILSEAHPGAVQRVRGCTAGIYPVLTYVIWNKGGWSYVRKIQGCCMWQRDQPDLGSFANFAKEFSSLRLEVVMPAISRATLMGNGYVEYVSQMVSHEPNYSFCYSINGEFRTYTFCRTDLDFKESIFHEYNSHLTVIKWWESLRKDPKIFF